MTTDFPNIQQSFARIDTPLDPPDELRDRLRRVYLELEQGPMIIADVKVQHATLPVGWTVYGRRKNLIRLPTKGGLRDLVAIALLFFITVGSLIHVTGPNEPAPGSFATLEPLVLQVGGSSANDRQLPGPAPVSGATELVGQIGQDTDPYLSPSYLIGSTLITTLFTGMDEEDPQATTLEMRAFNAPDQQLLWQKTIPNGEFAVTEDGVLATVPVNPGDKPLFAGVDPYRIALLDTRTGEPIWTTEEIFQTDLNPGFNGMLVHGDTVYITHGTAQLVAIALDDGQVKWTFDWPTHLPADSGLIGMQPMMAAFGSTIYVTEDQSVVLYAIDTETGGEKWSVALSDLNEETNTVWSIIAVDQGVIATTGSIDRVTYASTAGNQVLLLAAGNGNVVWTDAGAPESIPAVASDTMLFESLTDNGAPAVRSINIATGEEIWRMATDLYPTGFLKETNQLLLAGVVESDERGAGRKLVGIDPDTQETIWTVDTTVPGCALNLPAGDDGLYACDDPNGHVSIVRIVPDGQATPVATPEPESISTTGTMAQLGGTAAQDGQVGGPALGTGQIDPVWTIPEDSDAYVNPTLLFGTSAFVREVGTDQGILHAYDLPTQAEMWQANVVGDVPYAVTERGVVVAVPGPDGSVDDFAIALLDRTTGEAIWTSEHVVGALGGPEMTPTLSVDGDQIIVSADGEIAVLSLVDGTRNWFVSWATGDAAAADQGPLVAVRDQSLYVLDRRNGDLLCLRMDGGSNRWAGRIEQTGGLVAQLIAVDAGVVVVTRDQPMNGGSGQTLTLTMFAADVPNVVWTDRSFIDNRTSGIWPYPTATVPLLFSDGQTMYGTRASSIAAIDAATGELSWHVLTPYTILGFLGDPGQLILGGMGGWGQPDGTRSALIAGMDIATQTIVWLQEAFAESATVWGSDPTLGYPASENGWIVRYLQESKAQIIQITPAEVKALDFTMSSLPEDASGESLETSPTPDALATSDASD